MKKLSKPPAKQKVIHYGKGEGYNRDYGFVFSDELPYLRSRAVKMKEYIKKRKGKNG